MKATPSSLHGILAMSDPDGPEEEAPDGKDEGEGAKTADAIREFFEAGKAGDWEGAEKALHSCYAAFEAEDEPGEEDEDEEPEEEPESDDEE